MMSLRREVLSLYRRVLRLSQTWQALDPKDTPKERAYIRDEALSMFRHNRQVTDEKQIKQHLHEGEARIALAQHYGIPYPRPVNLPQNVLPPGGKRKLKGQERSIRRSKPIYIKSYEKES